MNPGETEGVRQSSSAATVPSSEFGLRLQLGTRLLGRELCKIGIRGIPSGGLLGARHCKAVFIPLPLI